MSKREAAELAMTVLVFIKDLEDLGYIAGSGAQLGGADGLELRRPHRIFQLD